MRRLSELLRLPTIQFLGALVLVPSTNPSASGALHFFESQPTNLDFGDQRSFPPTFGKGEFTFEVWLKPDAGYPMGRTDRGTIDQLKNWSTLDERPYSTPTWWFAGNFLLDGHTRPDGFFPNNTREGTFSLQFYGAGRLRWMFSDDGDVVPVGKVWTVEAYPASTTATLVDGQWHNVQCVRRWVADSKAQLELWIDGKLISTQVIPQRVNMRQFWDHLPHPRNPSYVGGWCWGSEVMTAWNYYFTQYEDYKGLVAEISFWDRAKTRDEIQSRWAVQVVPGESGLVGFFPLNENGGTAALDQLDSTQVIDLHHAGPESWSPEVPPHSFAKVPHHRF